MSLFGEEYLNHPRLRAEIEKIQNLFDNQHFDTVVRSRICLKSNFITVPLPNQIDKMYYVLFHLAKNDDSLVELDGTYYLRYDFRDMDKLSFVSAAIGDKVVYDNRPLQYPLLREHLVLNHKIYAVADRLMLLFDRYGKSPSVFYANPIVELRQQVNDFRHHQQVQIDEVYRMCLRDGEVDVKWHSEYNLYKLVLELFPNAIFQHSPEWLSPQSLDIYIDEIKTAIEYQGQQHYEPIEYFGGTKGFEKIVARDDKKKKRCLSNGVKIYYWKYDIAITKENLIAMLEDSLF